ncbi:MAG: phage structural protein [Janthinobacterium lividum]
MTYRNYNAAKLSAVFGGIPIHGFAEDTLFEIEFEDAQYNESSDIHGNITRARLNKNLATITLYLLQNSPSNNTLSSFVEADRFNDNGVFPITIKDANSDTLFVCSAAYVKQIPKISYGSENGNREWVIRATNISKFI